MADYILTDRGIIVRRSDDAQIPADPRNTDYQVYQAWLAAGNTADPIVVPPPGVPETVSNFQCRAVLMGLPGATAGKTALDDINAWVEAQGGIAYQAWEYGIEVRRDSPLITAAAEHLGLSSAQLDALFTQAATILV